MVGKHNIPEQREESYWNNCSNGRFYESNNYAVFRYFHRATTVEIMAAVAAKKAVAPMTAVYTAHAAPLRRRYTRVLCSSLAKTDSISIKAPTTGSSSRMKFVPINYVLKLTAIVVTAF